MVIVNDKKTDAQKWTLPIKNMLKKTIQYDNILSIFIMKGNVSSFLGFTTRQNLQSEVQLLRLFFILLLIYASSLSQNVC